MSMTRIDPPLPVLVALKVGDAFVKALAHAWVDYGFEHDLIWLVAVDDTREFWCIRNQHVRSQENISAGRPPAGGQSLRAMLEKDLAPLTNDLVIQAQIAAAEDPDWQPMREDKAMLRGYQCVHCGIWKQWPTLHACHE